MLCGPLIKFNCFLIEDENLKITDCFIICFFFQDCVLFHDSVYNNIAYGDLSAPEEKVYEAARMADIHDTIVNRFPRQYKTQVGERGLKLSG